jgi:2-keto-4-pentenoate hydratase/2-oxohepta-3-ene-1,7-dioic acid hydratase in catechol pathway
LLAVSVLAGCATAEGPIRSPVSVEANTTLPKLVRFISDRGATKNQACYAAVETAEQGIPVSVRVLRSTAGQALCHSQSRPEERATALIHLREALLAADRPAPARAATETIEPARRAARILPPVPVTEDWLKDDEVFVVAAGLNYAAHADEVGATEKILFPKPSQPTGAYADVPPGPRANGEPGQACLLDYEVEIAFIALQDIELTTVATMDKRALGSDLAFFGVNDVSDREPIILDRETGYTSAKARPGYLPAGPWLIAGRHLVPATKEGGTADLALALQTREAGGTEWLPRQYAQSSTMEMGPIAILQSLGRMAQQCKADPSACTMHDATGRPRSLIRGTTLPAGSLVLTGTPSGTAIKEPGLPAQLGYLLRGGLSRERATALFLADQMRDHDALGYLEPGDEVDQVIERLGRQHWRVATDAPAGAAAQQACGL